MKEKSFVVVVGGANVDICAQSYAPLIEKDSNPGFCRMALGGVGRNIAHNLALLDVDVCLLTAMGEDANADMIKMSCQRLGIDLSRANRVAGGHTSTYLFINGPDGDMALAVSDMDICTAITPEYLIANRDVLEKAEAIVLDTNIPEESILWLCENCQSPVFADPVSVTKSKKLLKSLGRIHTLKPNLLEASFLSGIPIKNDADLKAAAGKLLDTGLKRVFISLGAEGVFYADEKEMGHARALPVHLKNATGAGDAFMSGLVWSYLRGADIKKTVAFATAASGIAIEGSETINPEMSAALLLARAQPLDYSSIHK